jgi:GH15 family glucan-1,4-alpha-glucosidase
MHDGLVMRYRTECVTDGLPPGEGLFLPCSFWLADNLVLQGRQQEARELFVHLLTLRNDVGLLSEEYDTATKRLAGNFPQAFTHVALLDTAFNLTRINKPATQRHTVSDLTRINKPATQRHTVSAAEIPSPSKKSPRSTKR